MRTSCFALLLLAAAFARAEDISVGEVSLAIPNPTGYSAVTQEMTVVHDQLMLFVPPTSVQFLAFIPDVDVPAALRNEAPELPRRFTVQTLKGMLDTVVSSSDFQELKVVVKSQNAEIAKKVEAKLPGMTEKLNKAIAGKYQVDLDFSVSQILPMPVYAETDQMLAYSAFVRYEINDEFGQSSSEIAAVTSTFVNVRGKLLLLFSYAEESAVEWSKEVSMQWASSVLAANSPDAPKGIKGTAEFPISVAD